MNVERASRIQALKQHPAWEDFAAEIQEAYDRYVAAVSKTLMATGQPFPDFEYKRGYLKGQLDAAQLPDAAAAFLEKEAKKNQPKQEDEVGD